MVRGGAASDTAGAASDNTGRSKFRSVRPSVQRLTPFPWISLGAIVGANLRHVVTRWLAQWLGTGFPWGTFAVNIAGSLAIGVCGALISERLIARPDLLRWVVMVGFLGSLTTFSSFAWETHDLFGDGAWVRASANIKAGRGRRRYSNRDRDGGHRSRD